MSSSSSSCSAMDMRDALDGDDIVDDIPNFLTRCFSIQLDASCRWHRSVKMVSISAEKGVDLCCNWCRRRRQMQCCCRQPVLRAPRQRSGLQHGLSCGLHLNWPPLPRGMAGWARARACQGSGCCLFHACRTYLLLFPTFSGIPPRAALEFSVPPSRVSHHAQAGATTTTGSATC
jgi:hypothetical protein